MSFWSMWNEFCGFLLVRCSYLYNIESKKYLLVTRYAAT